MLPLERTVSTRRTWRQWFGVVFALDVRSLAVFRIAVGILLLVDLVFRLQTFEAMYTEQGYVTRTMSSELIRIFLGEQALQSSWSLHWIVSSTAYQALLFGLAALFAVLLALGLWTRVATIASFVLLASLHVRSPLVLTSGDFFLKLSLFWSMFLPLGAVWSIDARRRGTLPQSWQVISMASAGFVMQLVFMYFFTGLAKLNEGWFSGEAMQYALRLDIYIRDLGHQLLAFPILLKWVSWATLFVEVVFIWFLLSSWQNTFFRWANLLAYWGFHIGIALSMDIGLFPFICMVGWLPLIPTRSWSWLPGVAPHPAPGVPPDRPLDGGWLLNVVCGTLIGYVLLWNLFNIPSLTNQAIARQIGWRHVAGLGHALRIDQHFQMFGVPPRTNPWFVYEARLRDGSEVDLVQGGPVRQTRPESVRLSLPGHHWRKTHRNLVDFPDAHARQALLDYWVARWNREHAPEQQVVRARLICHLETLGPGYNRIDEHSLVWGTYAAEDTDGPTVIDDLDRLLDDPLIHF